MIERERIAAKVRALRAKTVENGCTEDEAVAAAAKAAELLARYNLTLDEVEIRASPLGRQRSHHDDAVGERLWKIAAALSTLTGAVYWASPAGVHPVEINFFGFRHEVEVARYLLDICARAMRQEQRALAAQYSLATPSFRRRKINPFLDGMADRLHRRILDLRPRGHGLVLVRSEIISVGLKEAGITTRRRGARPSMDAEAAYADGVRAGDRVALNQGLTGPARPSARALR